MTQPSPLDALTGASKASLAQAQAEIGAIRTPPATGALFTTTLDASSVPPSAAPPADAPAADPSRVYRGSRTGELSPEKQFESFMLRSFVEEMLPSENSAFFGDGTAGSIWKSMLAERIGEEMAAAGGIGIAEMVGRNAGSNAARQAGREVAADAAAATSATATSGLGGL